MLQKDKSTTASSKSGTSNSTETPVQFVKGVGPKLGAVFSNRGIETVKDLLTFFPRAYEDRSRLKKVNELTEGESASIPVRVLSSRKIPTRTGRTLLEVRCTDDSSILSLKWFHCPRGMDSRFTPGTHLIVTGTPKMFMGHPEIVHPEIIWNQAPDVQSRDVGRVVPIYTEIDGIPTRTLRKVLWNAIEKHLDSFTEDLPQHLLQTHQLPSVREAIRAIHFPPERTDIANLIDFNTPSHWRLIYEEFFKFEYLVLKQRLRMEREAATPFNSPDTKAALQALIKALPFQLTGDQKRAIDDIAKDLSEPHPMNRLIQGDVGSGKTAVALLSAGMIIAEGGQVTLMAPTEILAEQHFKNTKKLFGAHFPVSLLTGKTPQSERNVLQKDLAAGKPTLLIGTHAVLEDPIIFKSLDFIIIDEQHRFGVEQRRTLRRKGIRLHPVTGKRTLPHALIMTATPIPRTLALTAYGDLTVSSITEMPPGRTPIITKVVQGGSKAAAYQKIREELKSGHQAYFIYPLVNDSEAEGFTSLKSAVTEANRLATEVFPDFKVGLLHGQMKPEEKAAVMERFQKNELHVLVSTTVIEVGIDVPNSTVMAVEHAERFGLSQLHQLRGRVGRGSAQSYCFFFATRKPSETGSQRLDVLEQTCDGFKIAEADLEIRGPGEFLGTRQAGTLPFRLANLVRDREWLLKARDDAQDLLKQDPELLNPEHAPLRRYYEREGKIQFERLKTS